MSVNPIEPQKVYTCLELSTSLNVTKRAQMSKADLSIPYTRRQILRLPLTIGLIKNPWQTPLPPQAVCHSLRESET